MTMKSLGTEKIFHYSRTLITIKLLAKSEIEPRAGGCITLVNVEFA